MSIDRDITEMLKGTDTGFIDKNGTPICIGDEICMADENTGRAKNFKYIKVTVVVTRWGIGNPIDESDAKYGLNNMTVVKERRA